MILHSYLCSGICMASISGLYRTRRRTEHLSSPLSSLVPSWVWYERFCSIGGNRTIAESPSVANCSSGFSSRRELEIWSSINIGLSYLRWISRVRPAAAALVWAREGTLVSGWRLPRLITVLSTTVFESLFSYTSQTALCDFYESCKMVPLNSPLFHSCVSEAW